MENEREIYKMDTAIIVALVMAVPGLVSLVLQFRKSSSEITEKITSAAGAMLDDLRTQVAELKAEVQNLDAQVNKQKLEICRMKKGVNRLVEQIRKLGEEPCWIPDMESSEII